MKITNLLFLFIISISTNAQSIEEFQKIVKQHPDSAEMILKMGKKHLFSQPDSAEWYFDIALELAVKNKNQMTKANALKNIGVLNMVKSRFDSANYYLDMSAVIYQSNNYMEGYADVLSNKGLSYSKLSRYTEALENTHKALDLYDSLNLTFKKSNTRTNLGIIFQLNGDYSRALENYQKAIEIAPDNKKNVKRSLVNIATLYNKQQKYDSALSIYTMAQKAMEEENDIFGLSIVHNNIGDVYFSKKEYHKAAFQFKKAIDYKEKINNKQGQAIACKNLAETLLFLNKISEAEKWVSKSLSLSIEVNSKAQILEALLLSAQIDRKIGNHKKANALYERYIVLKDSLDNTEQIKAIEEIQEKYQSEHQQKEIAELMIQNQHSLLNIQKSTNQRNSLLFAIVLTLFIVGFLAYIIISNRKSNEILTHKNEVIQTALGEKETLLKEIHHRVKNNLQIISSLLSLQSRTITDKKAIQAVNESKNRVKSMALIHQKLYQKNNLTGIEMEDYIENLVESLFDSYGVNRDQISCHIDVSPIKLDVDTAIPLGLIINELVSNSLKHAFENIDGKLTIGLEVKDENLVLLVKDNGVGFKEEKEIEKKGFGLKLIESLAIKLKAKISLDNSAGTSYFVEIEKFKLV